MMKANTKLSALSTLVGAALLYAAHGQAADELRSRITFDNQSGRDALVKVVGPTAREVSVPDGKQSSTSVKPGQYYILVRYGEMPDEYTYSKGDPFEITETATEFSAVSITLHKVLNGNYETHPTTAEEFNRFASQTSVQRGDIATGTAVITSVFVDPDGHPLTSTNQIASTLSGASKVWHTLDTRGKPTGNTEKLQPDAKFVGYMVEGKLIGRMVIPEGKQQGLILSVVIHRQNQAARPNRYRKGHLYRSSGETEEDAPAQRAIWLGPGDYVHTVPGDQMLQLAQDGPGTIYRKGSVIDGRTISQDMMLTETGDLKPVARTTVRISDTSRQEDSAPNKAIQTTK